MQTNEGEELNPMEKSFKGKGKFAKGGGGKITGEQWKKRGGEKHGREFLGREFVSSRGGGSQCARGKLFCYFGSSRGKKGCHQGEG